MRNAVQLIAYVDRLSGGDINKLHALLQGPLEGLFGGVHLLPFYADIDGADAGFDPKDHTKVDARLGHWGDVKALSDSMSVTADLIAGHISRESPQFQDFLLHGTKSRSAELFLTSESVFPGGATKRELECITRPRPGTPFSSVTFADGSVRELWTTFTSSQIDIDVECSAGQAYLLSILDCFQDHGVRCIRLDAAGYAIKRRGTSCFMIPQTYDFIARIRREANDRGIDLLLEIHSHFQTQIEIAKYVDYVYDFALPPLVLHALFQSDTRPLKRWLSVSPRNCVTVLDTHDGIGIVDVGPWDNQSALLDSQEIVAVVERIHENSTGQSRLATGHTASNVDLYQVNCTFYDALGRDDARYLIARAMQLFCPGIPQIYYVGLLAGENDMELLSQTGVGRDINRHFYTDAEFDDAIDQSVVQALLQLIRLRNRHPAFAGDFILGGESDEEISLLWVAEDARAQLTVDTGMPSATLEFTQSGGTKTVNLLNFLTI